MKRLICLLVLIMMTGGCATRYGQFADGKEYAEYEILIDRDRGNVYLPLQSKEEDGK